ncbi:hypothetical protein [Rheinheimera texasensis]|uniref:hypothetical protein n=1 Tax=Rheinheimera texasensis TaxID=306205 RepID=UPI0004E1BE31|nr:hypothetical protein [Rheinheimera texasensis]
MKKPQSIQGEYIPRNKTTETTKKPFDPQPNTDSISTINGMLGKLNADQITSLVSGLTDLGANVLSYGKERENTKRVLAQTEAEIKKYESEVARTREEEKTKRKEIEANVNNNQNIHQQNMVSETNSHIQVMEILRQVQCGVISAEQLISLIHLVKTKGA